MFSEWVKGLGDKKWSDVVLTLAKMGWKDLSSRLPSNMASTVHSTVT